MRTGPDIQQLPCPGQSIEFQCQITTPTVGLTWTLPDGDTLKFTGETNVSAVVNSSNNNNSYSATLTSKTGDPDSSSRFFFTSTLLVVDPANGSNLTCSGSTGTLTVENTTTVTISGKWAILLS